MPNLGIVLVSPLGRTLETAYQLFHQHPNFKNMRFIVDPDLRECLDDSCTIPAANIQAKLKKYKKVFTPPKGGKTMLET